MFVCLHAYAWERICRCIAYLCLWHHTHRYNKSAKMYNIFVVVRNEMQSIMPTMSTTDLYHVINSTSSSLQAISKHRDYIEQIEAVGYGVIIPIICFIGVLFNIVNVLVLLTPRLTKPTYVHLFGLAIADLFSLLLFGLNALRKTDTATCQVSEQFN